MYCSACGNELPRRPPVTCSACGTAHWLNSKPCGGALVRDSEGRVLLVRRAHDPYLGHWDIPGGFCEQREHPRATAAREVREETGFEVAIGDYIGMWIDDYGETGDVTLNVYFHATVAGGEPAPDPDEVSELGWFALGELPLDEIAFPEHQRLVLEAWHASVDAQVGGADRA